jgi:Icc-related predicted phosphoesterase
VAETIQGEPQEIWPFLGSSRLAEVIDRHQAALALHGHAHHGKPSGKTTGGVPVHNVAISLLLAHDSTRPYRVFDL